MAASPQFVQTPINAAVTASVASTARDSTAVTEVLYTVPAGAGARIDDIFIKAQVTTTAGMVRFFFRNPANQLFLVREVLVTAITPSATVASWETSLLNLGWVLAPDWRIEVATQNAQAINFAITRGGLF